MGGPDFVHAPFQRHQGSASDAEPTISDAEPPFTTFSSNGCHCGDPPPHVTVHVVHSPQESHSPSFFTTSKSSGESGLR